EIAMRSDRRIVYLGLAAVAILFGPGCTPRLPPVVPVSGTVFLDGKPLPLARIEFVPDLQHFGAESNSSAVTDEEGRFPLVCNHQQQTGGVVGSHHVLVIEYVPDEFRGFSAKAQQQLSDYQAKLKNRPIPEQYGVVSRTPLTIEVKAGQETYDVQLTRS